MIPLSAIADLLDPSHSITSSARVRSALSPFQPKMERITPPTKLPMCQFVSAVQTSAEECPGQQSPQPPAARMEAPPSLESPPEPIPATGAIADPAPSTAAALSQDPPPTQSAAKR